MFRRDDGIVDFDKRACIGCKACIAACPYDAIFINPEDHSAEKCNFCAHRLDMGLEPACVVVCPTEAILVGDVNDPKSKVSKIVSRQPVNVRRPETETAPNLFYKGAHQATLDPIAARRPPAGLYMWSEGVGTGHPWEWVNSSAAAMVSYDVTHTAPWDWRVSLYTWTKSIAAGSYLAALLLVLTGLLDWSSALFTMVAPILGLAFLALTGIVLLADLEHPRRFHYLFTRPQWKSWLARGAVIILGYGAVLSGHLLAGIIESDGLRQALAVFGLPLSLMAAVYTAHLFAQSKRATCGSSDVGSAHRNPGGDGGVPPELSWSMHFGTEWLPSPSPDAHRSGAGSSPDGVRGHTSARNCLPTSPSGRWSRSLQRHLGGFGPDHRGVDCAGGSGAAFPPCQGPRSEHASMSSLPQKVPLA
jgi:ferredoxin